MQGSDGFGGDSDGFSSGHSRKSGGGDANSTHHVGTPPDAQVPPSSAKAGSNAASGAVGVEPSVAKAEGKFATFMKNEKWAGKKGIAFAVAAVALGVVAYGVSKFRGGKEEAASRA